MINRRSIILLIYFSLNLVACNPPSTKTNRKSNAANLVPEMLTVSNTSTSTSTSNSNSSSSSSSSYTDISFSTFTTITYSDTGSGTNTGSGTGTKTENQQTCIQSGRVWVDAASGSFCKQTAASCAATLAGSVVDPNDSSKCSLSTMTFQQRCQNINGVLATIATDNQNLFCHLSGVSTCPSTWITIGKDLAAKTCTTAIDYTGSCQGAFGMGCGQGGAQGDCFSHCTGYFATVNVKAGVWDLVLDPSKPPQFFASYPTTCHCKQYSLGPSSCPWGFICYPEFDYADMGNCEADQVNGVWCDFSPR